MYKIRYYTIYSENESLPSAKFSYSRTKISLLWTEAQTPQSIAVVGPFWWLHSLYETWSKKNVPISW
jgi:hypothetical protein